MPVAREHRMAEDTGVSAQHILQDAFGRIEEEFVDVVRDLTARDLDVHPGPGGNSIGWLLWHLSRIQDDHIAGIEGLEQVWTKDGWFERFGLPLDRQDHGYGHTAAEAAVVVVSDPQLLVGYHHDVHRRTVGYLDRLTASELARIVDEAWDPPVTAAVRLVSVIGDCMAHLGQAAYVKGFLLPMIDR